MKRTLILAAVVAFALTSCRHLFRYHDDIDNPPARTSRIARALIEPRSGSNVRGEVVFTEASDGSVAIHTKLIGVPEGVHGFHVHEKGDCSAPDGMSAGGHFNPTGHPHGAPSGESHSGDLGNLAIAYDGETDARGTTRNLTVAEGPNSVVGRAVIVHAGRDDLSSQPTGGAGGRIGCGVVTLSWQRHGAE